MFKQSSLLLIAALCLPQALVAHPPQQLPAQPQLAQPFKRQIPAELVGEWKLHSLADSSLPAESVYVASIAADGSFSTRIVNQCGGTIKSEGKNSLSFGPLFSTQMAGPPELMQLESSMLQKLAQVSSYTLKEQILSLQDAQGKVLLQYKRKAPKPDGKTPPASKQTPQDPDTPVSSSPQG